MKWRNQLLALLCLVIFAGLGVLYFQHWVVQKPFGIILIIGEGLAPERIAMTRVYIGGADAHLALDGMVHVALVKNASRDFAVSDQAAAASALATGVKVNNREVSVDPNGKPLTTILELARGRGRAIGLVTTAFFPTRNSWNTPGPSSRAKSNSPSKPACRNTSASTPFVWKRNLPKRPAKRNGRREAGTKSWSWSVDSKLKFHFQRSLVQQVFGIFDRNSKI